MTVTTMRAEVVLRIITSEEKQKMKNECNQMSAAVNICVRWCM